MLILLYGLRLAGIEYVVLEEKEEILHKIEELLEETNIGILAVTDKVYELAKEVLEEIELKRKLPLILKIPDRHGRK